MKMKVAANGFFFKGFQVFKILSKKRGLAATLFSIFIDIYLGVFRSKMVFSTLVYATRKMRFKAIANPDIFL